MIIEVTQADIDQGRRRNCIECPVALAVKRSTGHRWLISGAGATRYNEDVEMVTIAFPAAVYVWISHFDETGEGEPLIFNIDWAQKGDDYDGFDDLSKRSHV